MSRCTAFMLASRRAPPPGPPASDGSRPIPAVRLRTAPRRRIAARMPNTSVAVAMKIVAARTRLVLSSKISDKVSMALDLEIDQAVHDEIADHHPANGAAENHLGQIEVPDASEELRRDEMNHEEHADRQRRQHQRRHPAFGRQRLDLAAHLEPLPDHRGQVLKDLAE